RKRGTLWRRSRRPCRPSTMLVITTIGSSSPSHVLAMMKGSIDHSTSMVRLAISGMRAIAQPTGKNHARKAAIGCLRTNSVTFIVSISLMNVAPEQALIRRRSTPTSHLAPLQKIAYARLRAWPTRRAIHMAGPDAGVLAGCDWPPDQAAMRCLSWTRATATPHGSRARADGAPAVTDEAA